jgi:hypothetical protein
MRMFGGFLPQGRSPGILRTARRLPKRITVERSVVVRTYGLRLNGIHGFVMRVEDGGKRITVSGWHDGHWRWNEGDYLVLETRDGLTTRYRIDKMTRFTDPHDQYFADCTFAPRGA